MNKKLTSTGIACRIWLLTSALPSAAFALYILLTASASYVIFSGAVFLGSVAGSFPVFIVLIIVLPAIRNTATNWQAKFFKLLLLQLLLTFMYGLLPALVNISASVFFYHDRQFVFSLISVWAVLFASSAVSSALLLKTIAAYFSSYQTTGSSFSAIFNSLFQYTSKNNTIMETFDERQQPQFQTQQTLRAEPQSQSSKFLVKGIITGVLILLMLIPTIFINNIITEREQRQKEVVKDVSGKWATAQTISGPYLVVPYNDTSVTGDGKTIIVKKQLVLLANELDVNGKIIPEERQRSIYKVLLYKSNIKISGIFRPKWPADINAGNIDLLNAKLCFGISDFKGIEEEISVNFNNQTYSFAPGLPINDLDEIGLSVAVSLTPEILTAGVPFNLQVKLKGSEQLHFMPLAANSKFSLTSTWPNPSFDGNSLPNERQVTDKGFTAKWNFNQANLPFGTVIRQGVVKTGNLTFGVSMVQPADQYSKTMRSVKYAILFIGLTFALFFIIEIMQRKPFHPVQYVLVGLALVIFYTLLLSISEYILFDHAYLIAATATVVLISLYAKSHFSSWKTAAVFFLTLSLLYGFIFILIRLEDTALLVGSIGLFIVLTLVMYASRRINWYGEKAQTIE